MNNKIVYFLRHAENVKSNNDFNSLNLGLTENGIKQANSIKINNDKFECVFSSPYKRCIDTIIEMHSFGDKNIAIDDRLVMIKKDKEEFEEKKDNKTIYSYEYIFSNKTLKIPGMENVNDVECRLSSFLIQYLKKYNNILICTHASLIAAVFSNWTNVDCTKKFVEISSKYCYMLKASFSFFDNDIILNDYYEL